MHVRVVFTLIEEAEIEQRFFQESNSYKKVIILRYTKALGSVLIAPKQENWFLGLYLILIVKCRHPPYRP